MIGLSLSLSIGKGKTTQTHSVLFCSGFFSCALIRQALSEAIVVSIRTDFRTQRQWPGDKTIVTIHHRWA